MSNEQTNHKNAEQKSETGSVNATEGQQNQAARRAILKAAWVAPVVFSVAANQAFAASPMERRR